jgi:hypothetical protein
MNKNLLAGIMGWQGKICIDYLIILGQQDY